MLGHIGAISERLVGIFGYLQDFGASFDNFWRILLGPTWGYLGLSEASLDNFGTILGKIIL
jgi:hypothetical protein